VENHQQSYWRVWTLLSSALSRQTASPCNSWRTGPTGPGIVSPPGWSTRSCPTYGKSQHVRVTVSLNPLGRRSLLLPSDAWSQESLQDWDSIFPKFILHTESDLKSWFCDFLSSCMHQLKIPKIWRRALIVAIPKPDKLLVDRPISLLCVPFKILERLIYACVDPTMDPLLPREQGGFRHGRSAVDQVTLLTQDIEDSFLAKKKAGAVFIDLTAAYDAYTTLYAAWLDTWFAWSWRWLAIAASRSPPETTKEAGYDASRTASHRDLSWHPSLQHLHLWPSNHRLWKVYICWRSSNHACWWRSAGSKRVAYQGHGNCRWIPPDLEAKTQHYKDGVGSLPPQQQGS